MSEDFRIPSIYYPTLEYLASVGMIFAADIHLTEYPYWSFVWLKDNGFAVMETPDPNFLYQLPKERWEEYQFKITSKGMTSFLLLKEAREEHEKQKEKQRAEKIEAIKDKNENRRHDFKVAAFGGLITVLAEHVDDFFDLANRLIDILSALLN